MKRMVLNKADCRESFWCVIVLLFAFYPRYFDEIPLIARSDVFINLFIVIGVCFYIVKTHRIIIVNFFVIVFVIWQMLVTILNGGWIPAVVWGQGVLLISLVLGVQLFYGINEKVFLKTTYVLFSILLCVNIASIILFPNGMYEDQRGILNTNFFLGNYNGFIIYVLIALMFGTIYSQKYEQKLQLPYIILWILSFATYIRTRSVTSMVGLLFLFIYTFFLNRKWTRYFLNIKVYVLLNIIFFFAFVWNSSDNILLRVVMELLNKDITFTGRTLIWSQIKTDVLAHVFMGNGLLSGEVFAGRVGMIAAVNAHNLYLDLLFRTGVIGLGFVCVAFYLCCSKLKKMKNQKIRYFFEAFLGILMLMSQFEAYSMKLIFFVLTVMSIYAEKNSGQVKRTGELV